MREPSAPRPPGMIDMAGCTIGRYVVVEPVRRPKGARYRPGLWWWTLCTGCAEQYAVPGTRLRKMQRGLAMWRCDRCDPLPAAMEPEP